MFRKFFILTFAAIAVLVGATSCDKDTYQKTDMKYYKFADDKNIIIYDEDLIEVERREIDMQLFTQIPLLDSSGDCSLAFTENETGERRVFMVDGQYDSEMGDDFRTSEDGIEFEFNFNWFNNIVRIKGFNISQDNCVLTCIDALILKADIKTIRQIDHPFYQKGQILYTLKVEKSDIVVASATQDFDIGNAPEDEETGDNGDI